MSEIPQVELELMAEGSRVCRHSEAVAMAKEILRLRYSLGRVCDVAQRFGESMASHEWRLILDAYAMTGGGPTVKPRGI